MKINKILPLLGVGFLITTSCSNNNYLKRVTFAEKTYDEAKAIHTKIKNNQTDENGKSTLFNSGKAVYRYSGSATGKLRYDSYSFHNINFSMQAQIEFSWNLEKNYIKIEGENEVTHYMYSEKDNAFYQLRLYYVNGEATKRKFDETDDFNELGMGNLTIDRINYFTTFFPIGFSITAGLDGSNYSEQILPFLDLPRYNADIIFDDETHQLFEDVSKKYKDENKGYYLNQTFGSDNDSTLCATIKSKLTPADFREKHDGEFVIDAFASFKDNFISQFELILDGEFKVYRQDDVDLKIKAYVSEEVTQQDVSIDEINPDEYIFRK